MKLSDLTIEIRSVALGRLGQIDMELVTDFQAIKRFNNVGAWSMSLPAEYTKAQQLAQPGRGIILIGPANRVLLSGGVLNYENTVSTEDLKGTIVFNGVDDMIHIADGQAWPTPTNPISAQGDYDLRTGAAETVMRQYFGYNRVPGLAQPDRAVSGLALEPDLGRGATVRGNARYDKLGTLLGDLADAGGVGFDMAQIGSTIHFQVYTPADKSKTIRMTVANDLLKESKQGFGAPEKTRTIVAAQGQGADRNVQQYTTADSLAAEAQWGRKIEFFKDRRDTNDDEQIQQDIAADMADTGHTITSLSVQPADEQTMVYGKDWFLGDIVGVTVDGQDLASVVTEAIIAIGPDGVITAATIGSPTGFDFESKLIAQQQSQQDRIAFLEQNAEYGQPDFRRNKLSNARFRVNQRAYATPSSIDAVTQPNTYTYDRWKTETPAKITYVNLAADPNMSAKPGGAFSIGNCSLDSADSSWDWTGNGYSFNLYSATSIDSYMFSSSTYGAVGGKTYTLSATGRVKPGYPLSGTWDAANPTDVRTGRLIVIYNGAVQARSPQISLTEGNATRVSVTFTVPVGATGLQYRWYLGASSGQVQWDAIRLSETQTWTGADNTTYFDGSGRAALGSALSPSGGKWVYSWIGTGADAGSNSASRAEWFPSDTVATRYNFARNAHLQDDATNWGSFGATNQATFRQLPGGTMPDGSNVQTYANAAAYFQPNANIAGMSGLTAYGGLYVDQSDNGDLVPGRTYTISMFASCSAARSFVLLAVPYSSRAVVDPTAGNAKIGAAVVLGSGTWKQVSVQVTVAAPYTRFRIHLVPASGSQLASGEIIAATMMSIHETRGTAEDLQFFYNNGAVNHVYPADNSAEWAYGSPSTGSLHVTSKQWATVPSSSTPTPQLDRTLTLKSGHSLLQVVEQINIENSIYKLSWQGTALGRAYPRNALATSLPAFAEAPLSLSFDGTDDVVVEFQGIAGGGTLYKPQLEAGGTVTSFEDLPYDDDLRQCQRYFYRRLCFNDGESISLATIFTGGPAAYGLLQLPMTMRATPVMRIAGTNYRVHSPGVAITNATLVNDSFGAHSPRELAIRASMSSGTSFANGGAGIIQVAGNNTTSWIDADAELA